MSLTAKILSLNIGGPEDMHWNGKSVRSSMLKRPTSGPLIVHKDRIEGNEFANPAVHGAVDSLLYAYGISSAERFSRALGLERYEPGSTGETLTVDHLDETEVSVGDVFEIGEVIVQATFPRIPCGKVNFRMQHQQGQQAMKDAGRSGVYFRILNPGLIHSTDQMIRTERAKHSFWISRLYELIIFNQSPTAQELDNAKLNPAFLPRVISGWE